MSVAEDKIRESRVAQFYYSDTTENDDPFPNKEQLRSWMGLLNVFRSFIQEWIKLKRLAQQADQDPFLLHWYYLSVWSMDGGQTPTIFIKISCGELASLGDLCGKCIQEFQLNFSC